MQTMHLSQESTFYDLYVKWFLRQAITIFDPIVSSLYKAKKKEDKRAEENSYVDATQ